MDSDTPRSVEWASVLVSLKMSYSLGVAIALLRNGPAVLEAGRIYAVDGRGKEHSDLPSN